MEDVPGLCTLLIRLEPTQPLLPGPNPMAGILMIVDLRGRWWDERYLPGGRREADKSERDELLARASNGVRKNALEGRGRLRGKNAKL